VKSKKKKPIKKLTLTFVKKGETKKLKAFHVEWKDHAVSGNRTNWNSIDEVNVKVLRCHSLGYLVDEDAESIALAQNVGENGTVAEIITILKSCIVEKKEL